MPSTTAQRIAREYRRLRQPHHYQTHTGARGVSVANADACLRDAKQLVISYAHRRLQPGVAGIGLFLLLQKETRLPLLAALWTHTRERSLATTIVRMQL